ncbi:7-carboxy-7-deazaguanine synthase QueE [Paracoccus litorisediminis]|uniref:7-carboxy-7-deazaguanine synthase n=1 Tax=Paracoccus litorisediminis TaxID=2006130 RepID=A0A844HQ10_9RHOB|nr:7-carboxy-7-deazaguanine synthase QueE [Paracoccus litorisediminis]MTH61936.1 7-carboxy-7-deazaguanine synthase QueE [Paracoccus litorisediminis]
MSLRIAEIFGPTIQGEGALIGQPTVFVRAGGCDYRCSWCDSMHAVDSRYRQDWAVMDAAGIMAEVARLSGGQPLVVSISGGNPAIQDFGPVIALGRGQGYRFACETQGSVARDWFADLALLVLSPKPPSSGQETDWAVFDACLAAAGKAERIMKIVVFDQNDLDWARATSVRYPDLPLYLQPGNPETDPEKPVDPQALADRMLWLVEATVGRGWLVPRILPQLHVLIWGNRRGV